MFFVAFSVVSVQSFAVGRSFQCSFLVLNPFGPIENYSKNVWLIDHDYIIMTYHDYII
jgi:hypothetical protein